MRNEQRQPGDQQAKLISDATDSVEVRDAHGGHLGYLALGFTEEDISIAKHRMASEETRYTTEEVLDRLRSLDCK
jgi:hypothetical protein